MTRFYSEVLGKHDRSAFASGNDRIDSYFRTSVSQDVKRRYARCFVLIEKETNRLAGFHTLSATHIPLDEIPPRLGARTAARSDRSLGPDDILRKARHVFSKVTPHR